MKKLVLILALMSIAVSAQAQTCTRESLKSLIDSYFKAAETHNMSALPTAANLRITENGKDMKPGEGFLSSGGKVQLRRDVIDTERCATVTEAVTDETVDGTATMAVMAVRLKVVSGKVSEIETI